jgi:hypothetical protein
MLEMLIPYFLINLIIAIILWFAVLPKDISVVGYFLMMILFGIPLVILLGIWLIIILVTLGVGVGSQATYNLGDKIGEFFEKIFKR